MATLAQSVNSFDLPSFEDYYSSDPLRSFFDSDVMSRNTSGMLHNWFTSQADPRYNQVVSSAPQHPIPHETASYDFAHAAHLHGGNASYSSQFAQSVSSVSDMSNSMQSTTNSSLSSPHLTGVFGGSLVGEPNSTTGNVYASATNLPPGFDEQAFTENHDFLAGEKDFGFVGELQSISSSPSSHARQGFSLPSAFLPSSSSSNVSGTRRPQAPFKKPSVPAGSASQHVVSGPDKPSQKLAAAAQQQLQPAQYSRTANQAQSQPLVIAEGPAQGFPTFTPPTSTPSSPAAMSSHSDLSSNAVSPRAYSAASFSSHSFSPSPRVVTASPYPIHQDQALESLQFSPQSHFFHQSSGNFVAPLQSSYPSVLQPTVPPPPALTSPSITNPSYPGPVSPALSQTSSHGPNRSNPHRFKGSRSQSPFLGSFGWQPYPQTAEARQIGRTSGGVNTDVEEPERERSRCAECGKMFKDLKAHMLTHQNERPEKCPIPSCEYHRKGFSRKYDKNRHTLTHYKGTMVCGFCPHSGSAAEKSFNRADVFKRHLTTVHGVEQNPPNSRKRSPATADVPSQSYGAGVTGKCSICSGVFPTPQDFYEHLEDCVLSVVQRTDPGEAINERLLTSMADDPNVKHTLEQNHLPTEIDIGASTALGDDDDEGDEGDDSQSAGTRRDQRAGRGGPRNRHND